MPETLFTATELSDYIQEDVPDATAVQVERVVWGWLAPALRLTERPGADAVPPQVFSWAIELGAIAYFNPGGLSQYQLGAERFDYSSERRTEILTEAAASAAAAAGGSLSGPQGSFPVPEPWPDQIERW